MPTGSLIKLHPNHFFSCETRLYRPNEGSHSWRIGWSSDDRLFWLRIRLEGSLANEVDWLNWTGSIGITFFRGYSLDEHWSSLNFNYWTDSLRRGRISLNASNGLNIFSDDHLSVGLQSETVQYSLQCKLYTVYCQCLLKPKTLFILFTNCRLCFSLFSFAPKRLICQSSVELSF